MLMSSFSPSASQLSVYVSSIVVDRWRFGAGTKHLRRNANALAVSWLFDNEVAGLRGISSVSNALVRCSGELKSMKVVSGQGKVRGRKECKVR